MTIARLTAIVEAATGAVSTPAQVQRIGANLYALTANQDPAATAAQKAVVVVALINQHLRSLVRSGGEARAVASTLENIKVAADAASADIP